MFKRHKKGTIATFEAALAASRNPMLYQDFGVPDTFDGRFDALLLHLWPVFRDLKDDRAAQDLYDLTFKRMELALRESGAGDLAVGKHTRSMMKAFYGRLTTYNAAQTDEDWSAALRRNLYGTIRDETFSVPAGMIAYARDLKTPLQEAA
ncbi:MAG TPA: ubiquinol-cytochrome C chaperone family protein [Alphaproteobacteria bacterium]